MIGPLRDDIAKGMRGHVVAPYLILYRVAHDELLVVRIIDGRRDLSSLF